MKKLFTLVSVAALSAMTMAQSVTTHSVYDVNQSGDINVADVTTVVDNVKRNISPEQTQQYVTGEELNEVLGNIYQLLGKLDQKLNYMMKESGVSYPFPDEKGIVANGYEYVDLGVVVNDQPVYWATTNIGAKNPADYGLYFAWGETVGYPDTSVRSFNWDSYSSELCGGSSSDIKKYNSSDGKSVLEPGDDAAHVNWQGDWRMPTQEEQEALLSQCTWTWTTMTNSKGESVNGYKVSNKSDSSKFIFLPAAGSLKDSNPFRKGVYGFYWSATLHLFSSYANYLSFCESKSVETNIDRCRGHSVRPVCQQP